MSPSASNSEVSRRRILSAAGGAVAGGALATGAASAQSRVTRRVVIPRAEDLARGDYDGFFLHVGEKTPGELDASTLQNCDFEWSPKGVTYRKGTLVDHIGDEVERVPTTVYTNKADDIATGSLWAINNTVTCPKEFVGLRLEHVGAAIPGNVTDGGTATPGDGGGAGAFGPGFGAVGVAAAAGIGGLLAFLRGEDD